MVLARKYMQMGDCLSDVAFVFVVPASLPTLLTNLRKAWTWLKEVLSVLD